MTHIRISVLACAVLLGITMAAAQTPSGQTPPQQGVDPYAKNPDAGSTTFPLAAPAGTDSNAKTAPRPAPSIRDRSIRPRGSTGRHSIRRPARGSGIPYASR